MELACVLTPDINNPDVGDLLLSPSGQEVLRTALADEVAQRLYVRFAFFKGEWFLDLNQGTPWYQWILRKRPGDNTIRAVLSQVILGTTGVASVPKLSYTITSDRQMTIKFTARLADGSTFDSTSYPPFLISV